MHALTPTCMLKKDAARACAAVLTEVKTVPGVSILLLRMMHTPFCPARQKKISNRIESSYYDLCYSGGNVPCPQHAWKHLGAPSIKANSFFILVIFLPLGWFGWLKWTLAQIFHDLGSWITLLYIFPSFYLFFLSSFFLFFILLSFLHHPYLSLHLSRLCFCVLLLISCDTCCVNIYCILTIPTCICTYCTYCIYCVYLYQCSQHARL